MPERLEIIEGRRQSRQLVEWILGHYQLEQSTTTLVQMYWSYIAHQARTICDAKQFAERKGLSGPQIGQRVALMIGDHFRGNLSYSSSKPRVLALKNFTWSSPETGIISVRDNVIESEAFFTLSIHG